MMFQLMPPRRNETNSTKPFNFPGTVEFHVGLRQIKFTPAFKRYLFKKSVNYMLFFPICEQLDQILR